MDALSFVADSQYDIHLYVDINLYFMRNFSGQFFRLNIFAILEATRPVVWKFVSTSRAIGPHLIVAARILVATLGE